MKEKVFISYPQVYSSAGNSLDSLWTSILLCNNTGLKKELFNDITPINIGRINIPNLENRKGFNRRFYIIDSLCEKIKPLVELAIKKYSSERIGVFLGTSDHGSDYIQIDKIEQKAYPNVNYLSDHVHSYFNLKGPFSTLISSCTSSAHAIIKATQFIQAGIIDFAIVGGIELLSPLTIGGFLSLENVAANYSNPFSKNRDGITMSEAAVLFCLGKDSFKSYDHNTKDIYIAGYGYSSDAHHITAPHPDATGAIQAIKEALESAELKPEDINYVNLHGTGTIENDKMETIALKAVFGEETVPASTTKPITGHTLGVSSALEIAICFAALTNAGNSNIYSLPPQKWDGVYDENLSKINFVSVNDYNKGWKNPLKYCMSLSFAFGGSNAALILGSD